jgi:hypothetical protein
MGRVLGFWILPYGVAALALALIAGLALIGIAGVRRRRRR